MPKPRSISSQNVACVFRRFQTLLEAGVPVLSGLTFLADSEENHELREVIDDLAQHVTEGHRLSAAMRRAALPEIFTPTITSLIAVGEETGQLGGAVSRLCSLLEADLRLRRAVVSALTYPLALLGSILFAALLFVYILGGEGGLFASFGDDLPWPTRVLVQGASFLRQAHQVVLAGVLVFIGLGWLRRLLTAQGPLRQFVHQHCLELPGVGPLIRRVCSARILFVLANCLSVGLPMLNALRLSRESCSNDYILILFDQAIKDFRDGNPLSDSLQRVQVFEPMVTSMLNVGEEVGHLESIALRLAEMMEEDCFTTLQTAVQLIEPILLLFAGSLAAFLAVATLLPIIQMAQRF